MYDNERFGTWMPCRCLERHLISTQNENNLLTTSHAGNINIGIRDPAKPNGGKQGAEPLTDRRKTSTSALSHCPQHLLILCNTPLLHPLKPRGVFPISSRGIQGDATEPLSLLLKTPLLTRVGFVGFFVFFLTELTFPDLFALNSHPEWKWDLPPLSHHPALFNAHFIHFFCFLPPIPPHPKSHWQC